MREFIRWQMTVLSNSIGSLVTTTLANASRLSARATAEGRMRWKALIALAMAGLAVSCTAPAQACSKIDRFVNTAMDASAALLECIKQTPAGGRLELEPGTYTLRRQVRISKPVVIATALVADSAAACDRLGPARCATLRVDLDRAPNPNIMPIEAAAEGISLVHLIVEGSGDPKLRSDCSQADRRPLGGGMRVWKSNFTLRNSVLRNFACYTTIEAIAGANKLLFEDNLIGPNGDHRPGDIWSDGITIHDSEDTIVRLNRFVDNTDVQLILGGCRRCQIENNRFRHTGDFARASFAELMLQAFPSTSGDYTGTVVRGNDIDCGRLRLCGFGIMLGANPWKASEDPRYPGAMFGGTVSKNSITNAKIGINIDSPTGPVVVHDNSIRSSGGRFKSDCGERNWPALNIAPGAERFVTGNASPTPLRGLSTTRCILNRSLQ